VGERPIYATLPFQSARMDPSQIAASDPKVVSRRAERELSIESFPGNCDDLMFSYLNLKCMAGLA